VSDSSKHAKTLREFRDVALFLRNLWGILAGVSVESSGTGAFQYFAPGLVACVATTVAPRPTEIVLYDFAPKLFMCGIVSWHRTIAS
jgi:hypothetical protein